MTSASDYVQIARVVWPSLVTAGAVGVAGSVVGIFVLLRREAPLLAPDVAVIVPSSYAVAGVGIYAALRAGDGLWRDPNTSAIPASTM